MKPSDNWQRLPAVTLFYFAIKSLPQLFHLWPALVGLWATGELTRTFLLDYGVATVVVIIGLATLLPYWLFRYRVSEDHIQLRSGVFQRKRLTLYFERVQQADVSQPFYFRPFGYAILGLESAGSAQQEVDLPGLRTVEAEALRAQILAFRGKSADREPGASPTSDDTPDPDYSLDLSWAEVARYGLMHNGLVFLLPLLAPLMESQMPALEHWLASLKTTQLHGMLVLLTDGNTAVIFVLLSLITIVGALVLVYAASAAIALVRWWGYHLTQVGEQYQYRAGLFSVRTRGFRLHKLQLITTTQGIVARLLRRSTVTLSKAGGVAHELDDEKRFTIPVLSPTALDELKLKLQLPAPQWRRVSRFYIAWRSGTIGTLLAAPAAMVLLQSGSSIAPVLLSYPVAAAIIWRRWQCLGYFEDDDWLAIRTGFLGWKTRWLPKVKMQKAALVEPPWLRVVGLCNLHIWSADGVLTVPHIKTGDAIELKSRTLNAVSAFRGKWI